MIAHKLRTIFVLFGVAFLMSGTKGCQEDYCVACGASVGTTTPTETSTPTGTRSPTPTVTQSASPTVTGTPPTATPSPTETPTETDVPSARTNARVVQGTGKPDKLLGQYAPGAGGNWLGNLYSTELLDSDSDGFTDELEGRMGTDSKDSQSIPSGYKTSFQADLKSSGELDNVNALLKDTDADGCPDGAEILSATDTLNRASKPSPDVDGDCLSDEYERTVGLDPGSNDTDHDNVRDDIEVLSGLNPWSTDTDSDGILDWKELKLGTDPRRPDF